MAADAQIVEGMREYYARRAAYYERVYHKPERQTDLRAMEAWLGGAFSGRSVLEIACGTGWWTPHGAREARRWLATDINPETMAIARAKLLPACVRFAEVDAYTFAGLDTGQESGPGDSPFDAAFAARTVEQRGHGSRVLPLAAERHHRAHEPHSAVESGNHSGCDATNHG